MPRTRARTAPGPSNPTNRRACADNVAVLHDMLAEQLVEILISAVESLSKRPAQKRPAQKQAAWDCLSADWKELDKTKWQADPVAAVLAARAAAAEALLKTGEFSVEGWQPPEDPRLPGNQNFAGVGLLHVMTMGHAASWCVSAAQASCHATWVGHLLLQQPGGSALTGLRVCCRLPSLAHALPVLARASTTGCHHSRVWRQHEDVLQPATPCMCSAGCKFAPLAAFSRSSALFGLSMGCSLPRPARGAPILLPSAAVTGCSAALSMCCRLPCHTCVGCPIWPEPLACRVPIRSDRAAGCCWHTFAVPDLS